ncbi:MAG: DNA-processing protein DprA, partial [Gammaproteobacteria bacterium]|nr:DNA-processing protein DprA [Gammaproteobacteria bacterium]
MNRDDLAHYLALEACPGIGPHTFRRLLETPGFAIGDFSRMSNSELQALGFIPAQIQFLLQPPAELIDHATGWLDADPRHHILTLDDDDYPPLLAQTRDAPPILYTLGDHKLLSSPQIAIVGSRNCTPGGASNAEAFAAYLADAGLTITSGMALGIDKHAHQGALKAGGNTIAVIGTGIDRIYPSRNRQLAYDIAEQGLIVSEFPLGTTPIPSNFPKRNRIISGLSLATLVVEATHKSGSLITARHCLEQGREVFAIPGSIHNPQTKGCHQLIRQGAKLVDQATDIIDDIGSLLGYLAEQTDVTQPQQQPLEDEYEELLQHIGYDPVSIDTLVERSGLTIEQLSSMLVGYDHLTQVLTAW